MFPSIPGGHAAFSGASASSDVPNAAPQPVLRSGLLLDVELASIAFGQLEELSTRTTLSLREELRPQLDMLRRLEAKCRAWLAAPGTESFLTVRRAVQKFKGEAEALARLSVSVGPQTLALHLRRCNDLSRSGFEARHELPSTHRLCEEVRRYFDATERLAQVDDPRRFDEAIADVEAAIDAMRRVATRPPWLGAQPTRQDIRQPQDVVTGRVFRNRGRPVSIEPYRRPDQPRPPRNP